MCHPPGGQNNPPSSALLAQHAPLSETRAAQAVRRSTALFSSLSCPPPPPPPRERRPIYTNRTPTPDARTKRAPPLSSSLPEQIWFKQTHRRQMVWLRAREREHTTGVPTGVPRPPAPGSFLPLHRVHTQGATPPHPCHSWHTPPHPSSTAPPPPLGTYNAGRFKARWARP